MYCLQIDFSRNTGPMLRRRESQTGPNSGPEPPTPKPEPRVLSPGPKL